uniref:Uncharacterized protein n=1 Tax=Aplysina aerophoba bacterial symbiont clone pAE27P20 TaxID=377636 RepID=A4U8P3_9BACT|nr:hypothetical protein [Aplysina aerophoba bacterial symbiont clone pAE27P20]
MADHAWSSTQPAETRPAGAQSSRLNARRLRATMHPNSTCTPAPSRRQEYKRPLQLRRRPDRSGQRPGPRCDHARRSGPRSVASFPRGPSQPRYWSRQVETAYST